MIINKSQSTFMQLVYLSISFYTISLLLLIFIITTENKVTLVRIHFHILFESYSNSFSAHIRSLRRSTSRFLSQKYGVLSAAYAAKLTSFCSKNMSNVFILKSKGPNIHPWGTPYSIFDNVLKDEFILTLWSRSTK